MADESVDSDAGENPAEEKPRRRVEEETGATPTGAGEAAAPAAEGEGEAAPAAARRVKRGARVTPTGVAHITATFNNTLVSITDARGGVVSWCTSGRAGFKGSRKSTAFAATVVAQDAARQAVAKGMHEVEVRVQGAGSGRESAVRAIQSAGLAITAIKDVTPIPHNGCRARKRRRV